MFCGAKPHATHQRKKQEWHKHTHTHLKSLMQTAQQIHFTFHFAIAQLQQQFAKEGSRFGRRATFNGRQGRCGRSKSDFDFQTSSNHFYEPSRLVKSGQSDPHETFISYSLSPSKVGSCLGREGRYGGHRQPTPHNLQKGIPIATKAKRSVQCLPSNVALLWFVTRWLPYQILLHLSAVVSLGNTLNTQKAINGSGSALRGKMPPSGVPVCGTSLQVLKSAIQLQSIYPLAYLKRN